MLDRQLQEPIWQFDHTPGGIERIDEDSNQLADALTGFCTRVILTTLQKFPVVARTVGAVSGARFAVIVDEAHSWGLLKSRHSQVAAGTPAALGRPRPATPPPKIKNRRQPRSRSGAVHPA